MKNIKWTARFLSTPTVVRYCKRCGVKTTFASSGLFRVNAQQKALDIWLIYKCTKCDTTWNLTVYSRVNPHSLSSALLNGFQTNNKDLAMQCSTDRALILRNGAEPGVPEIEIAGEEISIDKPAIIELTAEWPAEHKAAAAIRKKLGLSRSEFESLCDNERLCCISGHCLKKCKLSGKIVFEIREGKQ